MRLNDKVAVVTGAAQGIGLACAERFLAEGAKVVLSDINADKLLASGRRLGAEIVVADASLKADVDLLIRRTIEIHGRIDILVSNAGITIPAEFLDVTEEEFDKVLRVNLKSQFLCGQAAAREMVRQGKGGVIINMSSVNAVLAIANQVPYAVSKGGSGQLTKVMAISLAQHGIRVVAIGPGTILTDMAQGHVAHAARAWRRAFRNRERRCLPGERRRLLHYGSNDLSGRRATGAQLYGAGRGMTETAFHSGNARPQRMECRRFAGMGVSRDKLFGNIAAFRLRLVKCSLREMLRVHLAVVRGLKYEAVLAASRQRLRKRSGQP
jgi:NAD(P)-dependent dehydrogenase (short-subunit alcohol dehydrogenase family)